MSNADSKFIWMEGKLTPYAEATVHVLSHTMHYGTGAFEGIRVYKTQGGQSAIFRPTEHYQRFLDSIKTLGCETPYTLQDLTRASGEVVKANGFKECYLRPLAYLDDRSRGVKLPDSPHALIAIAAWEWGKYLGDDGQLNGIRVRVSSFRRAESGSAMSSAKLTGNYVTNVLARREATRCGMDEALLLDADGYVGEGSGENLFMVKNGELFTPPTGAILPGITRDSVIQLCKHLGYSITERQLTRNDLYLADELFFTGTAAEVTPIRELDNYKIGAGKAGPFTRKLMDAFFKCVQGEIPEFRKWLEPVKF